MSTPRWLSLALLLLLVPFSGFADEQSPLVGTWKLASKDSRLTIEFQADGRFRAVTELGDYSGHWQAVDEKYLQTWSDGQRPKRTNAYYFSRDQLVIVDEVGSRHRHDRLK